MPFGYFKVRHYFDDNDNKGLPFDFLSIIFLLKNLNCLRIAIRTFLSSLFSHVMRKHNSNVCLFNLTDYLTIDSVDIKHLLATFKPLCFHVHYVASHAYALFGVNGFILGILISTTCDYYSNTNIILAHNQSRCFPIHWKWRPKGMKIKSGYNS